MSHVILRLLLPGWAKFVAQDQDGAWWCYEQEPEKEEGEDAIAWELENGRFEKLAQDTMPNSDWRNTLMLVE